ncbi:hypothetical protein [Amycolatopsis sp. NPDC059021]|uniref:hypothetical protein n=1 Tax=Amycolatopsis sp. NPDC059021 TaxID=3346704 RepID=UPI003670785F
MAYSIDIDPDARDQIRALPSDGVAAFAEAMTVLSLVPKRGEPLNADNPEGGMYHLPFGDGRGLITYLLLTDQDQVHVLLVTWVSFE